MVTDAVIQGAAAAFPAPFGWLLRGGWWFLKRIAGAPTRSGNERFAIYASINDARAGVPCIAEVANHPGVNVGTLQFQQITPGNTGISTDIPQIRALTERYYPLDRTFVPVTTRKLKYNSSTEWMPGFDVWYYTQNGVQNPPTGLAIFADGMPRATYNIMEVRFADQINVDAFESKIPVYLKTAEGQQPSNTAIVGLAVAKSSSMLRETDTWRVDTYLVYAIKDTTHAFTQRWKGAAMRYPVDDTYRAKLSIPATTTNSGSVYVKMTTGTWYAIQFVSFTTSAEPITQNLVCGGEVVGVIPPRSTITTGDHYFPVSDFTGDSSLVPVYGAGIAFTPFRSNEINVASVSAALALPSWDDDTHPSFGCDDAFEFPPPPLEDLVSDEDDFVDPEDDDEELELGPGDHFSDPPMSRLVVRDDAFALYEQLRATHTERAARLAVNQLYPSDEYTEFTEVYHDALADGLSPRAARAQALGL